jgi:hypothetical protein
MLSPSIGWVVGLIENKANSELKINLILGLARAELGKKA